MTNKIWNFLKINKEGALIGLLAGILIYKFFLPSDIDFSVVQNSFGILDAFKGAGTSTLEFAKTKLFVGIVIITTTIGIIIDSQLKERWFRSMFQ